MSQDKARQVDCSSRPADEVHPLLIIILLSWCRTPKVYEVRLEAEGANDQNGRYTLRGTFRSCPPLFRPD